MSHSADQISVFGHALAGRLRVAVLAAAALAAGACAGTIGSDEPPGQRARTPGLTGDKANAPGSTMAASMPPAAGAVDPPATPSTPIAPDQLDASCKVDRPHPRFALRLSNAEVIGTLRALVPFDDAAIPAGFAPSALGGRPDEGLTISRDFHENVDAIATLIAGKIAATPAANPLANLTCPLVDFARNEPCTTAFLTRASARLFRGMGTAQDVTNLVSLARGVAQRSDGKTALEYAVRGMVLNPKALYLMEGLDLAPNANPATPSLMSAGEMASFLSYRIVGKPPSDTLVAAFRTALAGTPTAQSVQQILATNFSAVDLQKGATDFFAAWLNVGDITRLVRDPRKHPKVDDAFMQKLQVETYDAIAAAMKTNAVTFAQVLSTEQRSASAGDGASPVFARFGRPGLFTLPGVLATVSNIDHTDIPRRGRFMLKQLFCDTVPSPPANLLSMIPPLMGTPSERQRFEKIELEPNCRGCHVRVNRLGFALENYDEMGVLRAQDEYKNPIVPASTHAVPGHPELAFSDARDLFMKAGQHPVVQNCLAVQTFRHFARRLERGDGGVDDACLIRDIAATGRASGFRLIDMFKDAMVRTVLAKRGN